MRLSTISVAAGLVLGNLGGLAAETGRFALSAQGRQSVVVFWEFAAFVANSLVFLLIGMQETTQNFASLNFRGKA